MGLLDKYNCGLFSIMQYLAEMLEIQHLVMVTSQLMKLTVCENNAPPNQTVCKILSSYMLIKC